MASLFETTVTEDLVYRDAQPVCLLENPYRLVSLLELIKQFAAKGIMAKCRRLGDVAALCFEDKNNPEWRVNSVNILRRTLSELKVLCELADLHHSALHAGDLLTSTDSPANKELLNVDKAQRIATMICGTIERDLSLRIFLALRPEHVIFYEPITPPFGQDIFDKFPSAIDDLLEASNCIAVERNTAAVFHLMRVMESGLKVLASALDIPYAPSWESYLKQINAVLTTDWNKLPRDVQLRKPFYQELSGDLQAIKISWRNPTMHIVRSYGPDEALRIFDCVKAFMIRLAEQGLSEVVTQ